MHIALHVIVPALISLLVFRRKWAIPFCIMMATMVVDLDHLWADPVYDPQRCSIGFHPLHGFIPIALYAGLCAFSKTRLIGVGLVIHMALDAIDCQLNQGVWFVT